MSDPSPPEPQARTLLQCPGFVLFWLSRITATLAVQVQSVALGWQIYEIGRRTMSVKEASFYVGMVGLAAFLPVLALFLKAGETADRHDRRVVLIVTELLEVGTALFLAAAAWFHFASIPLLLGVAVAFGAARAFMAPASTALGPMLVPRELLPKAIAWSSLAWQSGAILGPALGGLLLTASPALSYGVSGGLYLTAALLTALIRENTKPEVQAGSPWTLIKEGMAYVWSNKIVFGAISLDLFAVLLGGATALLPVFARDVLHVGPQGFGLLRAAPAIGAVSVALWLAANPIRTKAGLFMFAGVAVFGLATLGFGLSRWFWLSIVMLAILGGADMLSVFVRQTLVQLVTPDPMRGRVASVSSLFIGASNELGEFESGVAARFLGPVGAAIFGGVGAVAVTGLWAWLFPALRRADRLE